MSIINGMIAPPIGLQEVYTTLGLGKYNGVYDVGYACSNQHGKINSNSMYKPVRSDWWPKALRDEDYFAANFGYDVVEFNSYRAMRDAVDTRWSYLPPTTKFRLTDFNRYQHGATSPFELDIHNNPARNSKCFVSLQYNPVWFANWQAFAADFQGGYLNCGFYVPNDGMTYYQLTGPDMPIEQINDQTAYLVPGVTHEVGETYDVYFVFTTWASGNGDHMWEAPGTGVGKWWVLNAGAPATFRVLPEIRPIDDLEISVSNSTLVLSKLTNSTYRFSNISFDVQFKNTYSTNVSVSAELYANNVMQPAGRILLATMSAQSITPTETYTFHVNYSGTLDYAVLGKNALTVQIVMQSGSQQRIMAIDVPATPDFTQTYNL